MENGALFQMECNILEMVSASKQVSFFPTATFYFFILLFVFPIFGVKPQPKINSLFNTALD